MVLGEAAGDHLLVFNILFSYLIMIQVQYLLTEEILAERLISSEMRLSRPFLLSSISKIIIDLLVPPSFSAIDF